MSGKAWPAEASSWWLKRCSTRSRGSARLSIEKPTTQPRKIINNLNHRMMLARMGNMFRSKMAARLQASTRFMLSLVMMDARKTAMRLTSSGKSHQANPVPIRATAMPSPNR
jgi:hypothetical protein